MPRTTEGLFLLGAFLLFGYPARLRYHSVRTHLLQNAGIKPAHAESVEPSVLKRLMGWDAFLYVTITEWEDTWILIPVIRVTADYRLVDPVTGRERGKSVMSGTYDPIVTNSAGSRDHIIIRDLRVRARSLTRKAVAASNGGFPYGPYYKYSL